jgi:uncharacterized membrane protein YdbT with pleckstrin-like domain
MEDRSSGNIQSPRGITGKQPAAEKRPVSPLASRSLEAVGQTEPHAPFTEEVDVWWGAHSGRSAIPSFAISAVLTGILFGVAWYFKEWHGNIARYWVQAATGALWSAGVLYWLYRMVSTSYRLTTRRLLYYKGLFRPIRAEIDLHEVASVAVTQKFLDRALDVGQVRVESRNGRASLLFESVRQPEQLRREIEKWVKRSLEGRPTLN